jgi:uncharacterized protein
MAVATAERTARRIAEHVSAHGLREICLVLHGGEPLLTGPERLGELIVAVRAPLDPICRLDLRVHTNGVLLDPRFCELFRAHGVKVGISLDGDRASNDRHRRYRDGRSSYEKVVRAIELLRSDFPDLYSGLLCTIDVANDPIAVYDELVAHRPPAIDFLWPHHTWEEPPSRPSATAPPDGAPSNTARSDTAEKLRSDTAYADWLKAIVDKWLAGGRPVPVRMFDTIIRTGRGGNSLTESLGLEDSDLLVIETDGRYEQADSLKTAFDGAPDTGMDVFRNSIDEVGRHPGIRARQGGLAGLCSTCRQCPVVATCGGGLYAHRYRGDGSGFANPSVYCRDLITLIEHVQRRTARLTGALPAATLRAFASGYGDASQIAQLKDAQIIGRSSLIAAIGAKTAPSAGWDLLRRIQATDPAALDSVLSHPYVRVAAVSRLAELESGADPADDGLLATIAAVAAVRAGTRATLTVPVRDGVMYFPAIGQYAVPGLTTSTVEIADGNLEVAGAERVDRVRHLTAPGLTVALDDLDPFRDCHEWPAAPRLDDERFAAWQVSFQNAWTLLREHYGEYASAIAEALSTIVPLDAPGRGRSVSSAARDAFGSVAIALPDSPATLCLLLLHEFQHVKLGAILDFVDLYDPTDDRKYRAPWREDPRPLEGLLQGTYAHIAVADFWRRRSLAPASTTTAEAARNFDDWYPKTMAAVGTLQESGALTGLGEQFVAGMRTTLESWRRSADPR